MSESTKQVTVEQFIDIVLVHDIGQMVYDCKLHYLSFGAIAQGIEFLGACLGELPFEEEGQSDDRFRKAINKLFPKRYEKHRKGQSKHDLYQFLRCALVHQLRPQGSSDKPRGEQAGQDCSFGRVQRATPPCMRRFLRRFPSGLREGKRND
jgi:hypothetical protein